jgi:hypothetical protein
VTATNDVCVEDLGELDKGSQARASATDGRTPIGLRLSTRRRSILQTSPCTVAQDVFDYEANDEADKARATRSDAFVEAIGPSEVLAIEARGEQR